MGEGASGTEGEATQQGGQQEGQQGEGGTQQGGQPGAGEGTQQGDQQGTQQEGGQPSLEGKTPEEIQAILTKANEEAKAFRQRATAAEAKVKEHEQAALSDLERAQAKAEEAEAKAKAAEEALVAEKASTALVAEAATAGFVNPTIIGSLVQPAAVTFGDDGKPTNIKTLVETVAKEHPYLIGKPGAARAAGDAGAATGGQQATGLDMNERIRAGRTGA